LQNSLQRISPVQRKTVFFTFLGLTILLMIIFAWTGAPLFTSAAPQGVIYLQLAGSVEKAQQIIASWDKTARLMAAFGLGLDYLFMVVYPLTIGLACIWAADILRFHHWPLAALGAWFAWGIWLAALLDAVENIALTILLIRPVVAPWPQVAHWCVTVKFSLIFIGLVYGFYGLVVWIVGKFTMPRSGS